MLTLKNTRYVIKVSINIIGINVKFNKAHFISVKTLVISFAEDRL